MTAFVALLRAVNVGGTGKLAVRDLTQLCESTGFRRVRTYIASGNVVFESDLAEAEVKAALEARLHAHAGKLLGIVVRNGDEMTGVAANPFLDAASAHTVAILLTRSLDPMHSTPSPGDEARNFDSARETYAR